MTFPPIALEITDTGFARALNADETARALADIRRWGERVAQPPRPSTMKRFTPDRLVVGGLLDAVFSVAVALCQIAGAI